MNKKISEIKTLCDREYRDRKLVVPMGRIDKNNTVYMDFTSVSGLFIAGSTASGKSVFIDDIILGLMYKNDPNEVKICLIDTKKVELSEYNGLDYVMDGFSRTNSYSGYNLLLKINELIDVRIDDLVAQKLKSIAEYNKRNVTKLPHIFVVIDEGRDIISTKDAKEICERILDVGDNIGVHLIFSTNDYLKNYASSNFIDKFKYRVSFDMASEEQSKYIGIKGANQLLGNGEAYIKSFNSMVYKFHAPYSDINNKNDIKIYIGKEV